MEIGNAMVSLYDLVSWAVLLVGFAGTFTWVKLTLQRHHAVIFNDQGEIRVVSFTAIERMQKSCQEGRRVENDYIKLELARVTAYSAETMEKLLHKIDELTRDIRQLSKCVSILATGGKPEDCG